VLQKQITATIRLVLGKPAQTRQMENVRKRTFKNIVLDAPVREIFQDSNKLTIKSDKGGWQASHVVVAVPLPLSVRIAYDPPLPPHRDILAQHLPMGSVIKCYAAYRKPFWRGRGLNGLTWNDKDQDWSSDP